MAALGAEKGTWWPPPPLSMLVRSMSSVSPSMPAELHEPSILLWPTSGPRRLALPLSGSAGEAELEGDGSDRDGGESSLDMCRRGLGEYTTWPIGSLKRSPDCEDDDDAPGLESGNGEVGTEWTLCRRFGTQVANGLGPQEGSGTISAPGSRLRSTSSGFGTSAGGSGCDTALEAAGARFPDEAARVLDTRRCSSKWFLGVLPGAVPELEVTSVTTSLQLRICRYKFDVRENRFILHRGHTCAIQRHQNRCRKCKVVRCPRLTSLSSVDQNMLSRTLSLLSVLDERLWKGAKTSCPYLTEEGGAIEGFLTCRMWAVVYLSSWGYLLCLG